MTEEEIKELQDKATELEKQVAEAEKSKADYEKTIAEKDALIKQKTEDVVGARKKFKKLEEMSEEEKEAMTEKEIELQQRQEELDARQAKAEEAQKETLQKEINARRANAIKAYAGEDEELAQKIEANFGRISDSKGAQTEDEIRAVVQDAYNMLGTPAPSDAVSGAFTQGGDGRAGDTSNKGDFSETPKGKDLAGSLGLNQVKSEDNQ